MTATCIEPSSRVIVENIEADSPDPAVTVPDAINGGQTVAQEPVQALLFGVSDPKTYRVMPAELVKIC